MADDESEQAARASRRERRLWIKAHHPDLGGDPTVFAEEFARPAHDGVAPPQIRRTRSPGRLMKRIYRAFKKHALSRRNVGVCRRYRGRRSGRRVL